MVFCSVPWRPLSRSWSVFGVRSWSGSFYSSVSRTGFGFCSVSWSGGV